MNYANVCEECGFPKVLHQKIFPNAKPPCKKFKPKGCGKTFDHETIGDFPCGELDRDEKLQLCPKCKGSDKK